MARRKNTAKKTTGGPAPKVNLTGSTSLDEMDLDPLPAMAQVPPMPSTGLGANFCSIDLNGGNLFICQCGRALCADDCIQVDYKEVDPGNFVCPACYKTEFEEGKPYKPFIGSDLTVHIKTSMNTRSYLPIISSDSLAIITFRLKGMPSVSAVSNLVLGHLADYFSVDGPALTLRHFELEFEFSVLEDVARLQQQVRKVLPDLKKFTRFLVFIVTHSEPDGGRIWIKAGKEPGSVNPGQFFDHLFTKELLAVIKTDKAATLFMVMCGGPHAHASSRAEYWTLNFWLTFGFSKTDFHPSLSNLFLMELCLKFFVNRQPAVLGNILLSNVDLGAHAEGIFVYIGNTNGSGEDSNVAPPTHTIIEYRWCQELLRPHGYPIPVSCPECRVIGMWKVATGSKQTKAKSITTICGNPKCSHKIVTHPRELTFPVSKHGQDDGVLGMWKARYVDMPGDTSQLSGPPKLRYPLD
ncbi:hypothetical protein FPV67DRAFT_1674625 [Lyophyllum atratum]|nr:hypothetical protein FPV67DRAFT_1674625 [Lyophyllum atratum]